MTQQLLLQTIQNYCVECKGSFAWSGPLAGFVFSNSNGGLIRWLGYFQDMNATSQSNNVSICLKDQQIHKKLRKRKFTRKENDDLMMILMHDAQMRLEQMLLSEWKLQVKVEQQLKTGQLTEDEKIQHLHRREIRAEQRTLQEKRAQKSLTELEQQINSAMDAEQKALQELIKQKQHKITVQLSPEEEEINIDEPIRYDIEMSGEKSLKVKKKKLGTLRRVLEKQ
ncbi:MAG: hypothetical protein EZS28_007990 [Streblomastix strix]|uniref:Uncharacterized protein n=1 Tax=Streblomastix strix TaxID=222440 RepID=A0A5J4WNI5_9EUKA|nr:MAG: hypothetical protein EZS28_007990 [Streblomastix strix]